MQIPVSIISSSKVNDEKMDFMKIILKADMSKNFDIKTSRVWAIFMKTIIKSGLVKIIIDMSELTHIESSSIAVLINIAKLIRAKKGDIGFLNVPKDIEEVFKMVQLNRFIKFFDSEKEAINFFRIFV